MSPTQLRPKPGARGPLACAGGYATVGKPLVDALLLVTTAPFALALALPIAAANAALHGPRRVLFRQVRVGRGGRPFVILKFRTMRDPRPCDPSGSVGSAAGDRARVTRFGRFLRSTHLDELPQLVNVLRGEMSVIGPRPEMTDRAAWAAERLPGFERRHVLRPGITGWAQVTEGYAPRTIEAYRRKLDRDEEYLRALSLRFDLLILARTAAWMARGRGWSWSPEGAGQAAEPDVLEREAVA